MHRILCAFLLLAFINGCSSSSDGGESDGTESFTVRSTSSAGTDGLGETSLEFNVPAGSTAFQLIVESPGTHNLQVISLIAPDGGILLNEADTRLSGAITPQRAPIALNYPILPSHVLQSGRHTVRMRATQARNGQTISGLTVNATLLTKDDSNFGSGNLHLNLVMAGPVADDESAYDGVNKAVEKLERIFDRVNISITRKFYFFSQLPSVFPDLRDGAQVYETIAALTDPGLNIIFATDVEGLSGRQNAFAFSAGITCPALAGTRNGIVFSVLESTGNDGRFDGDGNSSGDRFDDEVILLAQNMAHYIGRCLGLFPIVEFQGSTVVSSDILSDTASCINIHACEENSDANRNVMFPFPLSIPNDSKDFFSRDEFSATQGAIMQRAILVN